MLFHKNPGNDFEVYNDFNGLLTNLYRCVREKPDLLMGSLRYVLNAREDFDRARLALRRKRTTSVQRAAWFYQIIRQSYASALTSFGNQPHDLWADFPLIEQAHRRLARVVIENKDFEKLIRERREKNYIYYELNTSVFEELLLWASAFTADQGEYALEEKKGELHHET